VTRRAFLIACGIALFSGLTLGVLFPMVETHLPAQQGSLCVTVDRLCRSAVLYELDRNLKGKAFPGNFRCTGAGVYRLNCSQVIRTTPRLDFLVLINPRCVGGDCIRAIKPTAQNAR
jgi:hypothetical protein